MGIESGKHYSLSPEVVEYLMRFTGVAWLVVIDINNIDKFRGGFNNREFRRRLLYEQSSLRENWQRQGAPVREMMSQKAQWAEDTRKLLAELEGRTPRPPDPEPNIGGTILGSYWATMWELPPAIGEQVAPYLARKLVNDHLPLIDEKALHVMDEAMAIRIEEKMGDRLKALAYYADRQLQLYGIRGNYNPPSGLNNIDPFDTPNFNKPTTSTEEYDPFEEFVNGLDLGDF